MAELFKAPLVQGVAVSAADGGFGGSRGDPGNVRSRYRVTQSNLRVLSGLGREGKAPCVPQSHQAVVTIGQPDVIDAQQVGNILLEGMLHYQCDGGFGEHRAVKTQVERFPDLTAGAVGGDQPVAGTLFRAIRILIAEVNPFIFGDRILKRGAEVQLAKGVLSQPRSQELGKLELFALQPERISSDVVEAGHVKHRPLTCLVNQVLPLGHHCPPLNQFAGEARVVE